MMVNSLAEKSVIAPLDVPTVLAALAEKERRSQSAIGHSLAVPHAYLDWIPEPLIAIGRLESGINASAPER